MKISKELCDMLINQIAHERQNNTIYTNVASKLKFLGLDNLAKFFTTQADDETGHSKQLSSYLNDRNVLVTIPTVEMVDVSNYSPLQLFQLFLDREVLTTDRIEKEVSQAELDGDKISHDFLLDFVYQQREEEDTAQTMLDQAKMMGDNMGTWLLYNNTFGD